MDDQESAEDEEFIKDARSHISPLALREFPDSALLASDVERMSKHPDSLGKVRLSCCQGRLNAFLPMFPPEDGHGEGGVMTDAGPCPCGGDRAKCRFGEITYPAFDLAEAIRQAADMVQKADSLPHVTRRVKCPKGCKEDHKHELHGAIVVSCTTIMDQLIPYARRCLQYAGEARPESPSGPAASLQVALHVKPGHQLAGPSLA